MHRSDPALIQRCLRGESEAWNQLVDRYSRLVYSIARRYGLADSDADDVLQAVFLILYSKLDQLADQTRLSAWLITIAHRECWRIGRQKPSTAELLDRAIPDVSEPAPELAAKWERQQLVREGLQQLGGRCEQLLGALFLDPGDPDYEAIAARLGMKVGSIGPTRARCLEKLANVLAEMGCDLAQPAAVR